MVTLARLLVVVLLLTACGSGATVASEQDVADLEATVEEVAGLCGDQDCDRDRLRDLTGDQVREQLRDQDMDRFLDDSEDLQVRVSDVTVDGDEATVRVRYRTPGRWDEGDLGFERGDDGRWRLQALPECAMDGEE